MYLLQTWDDASHAAWENWMNARAYAGGSWADAQKAAEQYWADTKGEWGVLPASRPACQELSSVRLPPLAPSVHARRQPAS